MRNSNAILNRNDVRAGLLALALGCLSLSLSAAPVNRSTIGSAGLVQTGRTSTLTAGGPMVNSGGSTLPMYPSGGGGWTAANNYGVPASATPPTTGGTLMADGKVYIRYPGGQSLDGVNYPVKATYTFPWSTVAAGVAGLACAVGTAGVCAVAGGAAAAMPYVMDWLQRANISRNSSSGALESPQIDPSWPKSDGYQYYTGFAVSARSYTREEACQYGVGVGSNSTFEYVYDRVTTTGGAFGYGLCYYKQKRRSNGQFESGTYAENIGRGNASDCPSGYYRTPSGCTSPASLPKVAIGNGQLVDMLGNVTPDSRVFGEVLERGGTIDLPNPTVSGPSNVQGPETVTQKQDGTKEVSRTTYNFQTSGNTITNTTNITMTNYYNSSNVQTGTQTQTQTPTDTTPGGPAQQTPQDDACTKHPEALGCKSFDFDTPDGEIPRDNKTITYQEESLFGGGSCPADKSMGFVSTGQTLKVVDWQSMCSSLLPIRAVVMALALFGAFLILMPGKGES